MKSPHTNLSTALVADVVRPCWLVEIFDTTTRRYALYPSDISFNSVTFTGLEGNFDSIGETTEGQVPRTRLKLQNVDGTLGTWARAADKRGLEVHLHLVVTDQLSEPTAVISFEYHVVAYGWDHQFVTLDLGDKTVSVGRQCPARKAQGTYCVWTLNGTECGAPGNYTVCDRTYANCKKIFGSSRVKRFGGFLGAPNRNIGVL